MAHWTSEDEEYVKEYLKETLKEMQLIATENTDDLFCKDDLFAEKGLMLSVMKKMDKNGIRHHKYNCSSMNNKYLTKNSLISTEIRNTGNRIFAQKAHNELTHRNAFIHYTKSIAVAPNDSKELSLGYSNRAALLCHQKKYEECIQDCKMAMKYAKSDDLKIKVLFRKAEAFIGLKEYANAKDIWNEANALLKKTTVNPRLITFCDKKSGEFSKVFDDALVEDDKKSTTQDIRLVDELPTFEPSIEAPSASEAVAIKYNKEWGRHIVATRSIEVGEILVREKSYFSFLDSLEMYSFCSFCTKPSWNLIPCEGCVFDVYCSDKCRLEAQDKYHKFECPILLYLLEKEDVRGNTVFGSLRFLLIAVYNAGGLERIKEEQIAAYSCTDPRKKGFTEDGIFDSNELRSCLSLNALDLREADDFDQLAGLGACYAVYHLATKTDYFGKKYDITPYQMRAESSMVFFAALMCRQILSHNTLKLKCYRQNSRMICPIGISLYPFCSLFNNSCSSNTDFIITKDNEIIVYASQPIEKESQVFISYYQHDIILVPKHKRNMDYENFMKFTCKCTPCTENWSHICLPLLKDLLETAPDTLSSIKQLIDNIEKRIDEDFTYKQDFVNEITKVMKMIAEKVTVNCAEYRRLETIMKSLLMKSFGKMALDFPDTC